MFLLGMCSVGLWGRVCCCSLATKIFQGLFLGMCNVGPGMIFQGLLLGMCSIGPGSANGFGCAVAPMLHIPNNNPWKFLDAKEQQHTRPRWHSRGRHCTSLTITPTATLTLNKNLSSQGATAQHPPRTVINLNIPNNNPRKILVAKKEKS